MLLLFILIGLYLKLMGILSAPRVRMLNKAIINIILPAMIFSKLRTMPFNYDFFLAGLSCWLVLILTALILYFAFRRKTIEKSTALGIFFSVGFANTSFVGFPLIKLYFGEDALKTAVLVDQLGTFLSFSIIGTLVSHFTDTSDGKKHHGIREVMFKITKYPPMIALILASVSGFLLLPRALLWGIEMISNFLIPLSLISVGSFLDLDFSELARRPKIVISGLALRLVIAPFFIFLIYNFIFGFEKEPLSIIVAENGMGPMITSSLLAIEKGYDPGLVQTYIKIGIPLSIVSVYGIALLTS